MKRNERKEELEFRYNMIRFTKAGDACRIFKGKHMIGGTVFHKHTYLIRRALMHFKANRKSPILASL